MKLLVLSNGHGEDVIAVSIIKQLQLVTDRWEIWALPLVGKGYAYTKVSIPIIGKVEQMPSGGFVYMSQKHLWQDIQGGLINLTLEQIRIVRQWSNQGDLILAVGDIVPLLFAWLSSSYYAFVGTAKSEYYLRDITGQWLAQTSWLERKLGSVYLPWERWLMSRDRALAVYPRDILTSQILQQHGIKAYNFGNPMMDDFEEVATSTETKPANHLYILLLPGSRMPEALKNWQTIMTAVSDAIAVLAEYKLIFLAAIAPGLEITPFQQYLLDRDWKITSAETLKISDRHKRILKQDKVILCLTQNAYSECGTKSDMAIAMSGTGTEQFVGLGKPAFIIPGEGPQFTYNFAEAQTRLLGCSVTLVETPQQVGKAIKSWLNNPQKARSTRHNGKTRMGNPGAAQKIALHLTNTIEKELNLI
ncbi:MAG: lipid-A-disaccharide synthase-related protein [Xenococcaceae cyanobacterium MO_167.B27]|nr:lipid-A-disaccharide synthase-related protein [Xenococcaceae cyanobacterium MO_167.B27]